MEKSKKLVVYHSYTGHTKMIANIIQQKLNCDILEIKPEKEYSKNYDEVVSKYQNNRSQKETTKIFDINIDLRNFDEIIVGSPVWWYTITPPIRTFLIENDLSNKVIVPFITDAGWGGSSFSEIKSLCPNSEVKEGKDIVFSQDYSSNDLVTPIDEINSWIDTL